MVIEIFNMNGKFTQLPAEPPPRQFSVLKKIKPLKIEDPMSHRIIEKRRRDRMNNCLADLSRLIPAEYMKKGRGRIEKTEIIEMAIKHMRYLQSALVTARGTTGSESNSGPTNKETRNVTMPSPIIAEHYRLGYLECLSEAMHFLVEVQGFFAGDTLCVQIMNHLHKHCEKLLKGNNLNLPQKHNGETTSNSSSSTTNGNYNISPPLGMSNSTGSNSDDQNNNGFDNGPRQDRFMQPTNEQEYDYSVQHAKSFTTSTSSSSSLAFVNSRRLPVEEEFTQERNCSRSSGFHSLRRSSSFEEVKENDSQLRDILTSPNSSISGANLREKLPSQMKLLYPNYSQLSSNCESETQSYPTPFEMIHYDNEQPHPMYKFKNTIQQRFSKEIDEHQLKKQKMDDTALRFNTNVEYSGNKVDSISNRLGFGKKRQIKTLDEPDIAVFALHGSKTFYIPLTLEKKCLVQYLSLLGYEESSIDSKPVLHPVTISVNFQPQIQIKEEPKFRPLLYQDSSSQN